MGSSIGTCPPNSSSGDLTNPWFTSSARLAGDVCNYANMPRINRGLYTSLSALARFWECDETQKRNTTGQARLEKTQMSMVELSPEESEAVLKLRRTAEEAERKEAAQDKVDAEWNLSVAQIPDDQRLRRNIQWGIVRGLFMFQLCLLPVAIVITLAYVLATAR